MEGDDSQCHYDGNSPSTSEDEELPKKNVDYTPLDRIQTQGAVAGRQPRDAATMPKLELPAPVDPEGKPSSWEGGPVPMGGKSEAACSLD
jgi:hypothetical protein